MKPATLTPAELDRLRHSMPWRQGDIVSIGPFSNARWIIHEISGQFAKLESEFDRRFVTVNQMLLVWAQEYR